MSVSKLKVRAAMMAALKTNDGVTALIDKAAIYPGTVPATRPTEFARFGSFIASPFAMSGLRSASYRVSVQGFSHDLVDGAGTVIKPAEDNVNEMGDAIETALDGTTLDLGDLKLRLEWLQTIATPDPTEASAWMVTTTFTGEVAG